MHAHAQFIGGPMQTITINDHAVALSDAFRCLVKLLDQAGVLKIADLVKAMQTKADSRRAAHEDGVAAATALISSALRS
jgi:hypothetical protein